MPSRLHLPASHTTSPNWRRHSLGLRLRDLRLSATFIGDGFIKAAAANPEKVFIYDQPRGSPKNIGKNLTTVHPVVRTNPVTGWKSIYAVGPFPKYINELNPDESEELLKKLYDMILQNHDLTVRLRGRNPNDLGELMSFGGKCVG